MKKGIFLVAIAALLLSAIPSKASHLLGGEITWECIPAGPDAGKFIFQIKLYRACYQGAASLSTTAILNNPLYASYGGTATITCAKVATVSLAHPCFSINYQMACNRPLALGGGGSVEEWIYRSAPVQINGVPSVAGSEFYWTSCCRPVMLNIIGSGYYLRSVMYPYIDPISNTARSMGTQNGSATCYDSSPQFASRPAVALCKNQIIQYDHTMIDVNNDSIRYDWSVPMQSATNPILWKTDYSTNLPLPNYAHDTLNVGPYLDTTTGVISYYSNSTLGGYHSLGVKGTSYKNGQKVAEVYRDIIVTIFDCDTITSSPQVSNTSAPTIGIKESSASAYNSSFQGVYPVGSTISLDLLVTDVGFLPTSPISGQAVDLEIYGVSMSSTPNSNTNCLLAPCAYLDSNNTAWNGYQFIDTNILSAQFTWNTSCLNLEDYSNYTGGSAYRTFVFQVKSKDNWCPIPGQEISYISIGLVDTSSTTWPVDTLDASNGGAMVSWPQYMGSNFVSYEIYRSYDLLTPWVYVGSVTNNANTTYYDLSAKTDSTAAFYLVEINNGPGCYIGYEVKSMHLDAVKSAPTKIQLDWNNPYTNTLTHNNGKYLIYRMDTLNVWNLIDSTLFGFENYVDTNVVYNSRMDYKVESIDPYGLFTASNVDTARIDTTFIVAPGIQKLRNDQANIYPNPFKDELVIELLNEGQYELQIYNTEGKMIHSGQLNNQKSSINSVEFPEGIYYLRFRDQSGRMFSKKVVKTE